MARGNQRDKAREKTQKEQAAQVRPIPLSAYLLPCKLYGWKGRSC